MLEKNVIFSKFDPDTQNYGSKERLRVTTTECFYFLFPYMYLHSKNTTVIKDVIHKDIRVLYIHIENIHTQ